MTPTLEETALLVRLCKRIAGELEALPSGSWSNAEFVQRRQAELAAIGDRLVEEEGATISPRSDGTMIRLAGIRGHSTMGLAGALQNWRTAAQRRIAAGGGA